MKDRLINIICECLPKGYGMSYKAEEIAGKLIQAGIIFPKFKIGQEVFALVINNSICKECGCDTKRNTVLARSYFKYGKETHNLEVKSIIVDIGKDNVFFQYELYDGFTNDNGGDNYITAYESSIFATEAEAREALNER